MGFKPDLFVTDAMFPFIYYLFLLFILLFHTTMKYKKYSLSPPTNSKG